MPSLNKYYFFKEHFEPRSVHGAVNKANRALTVWVEGVLFFSYLFSFSTFWPHQMAGGILVPWPGIEPESPAVETWCLNHWATREVLREHFSTPHLAHSFKVAPFWQLTCCWRLWWRICQRKSLKLRDCSTHHGNISAFMVSVLVGLGCYNEILKTVWLINNINLFFTVLESGSLRSRHQSGFALVRALSLVHNEWCVLMW